MTKPLVCVTVTAATLADLRRQRDALGDADLVELRLDTVSDPDAVGALAGRRTPAIVTCRARWEGGQFRGSEEERRRILEAALAAGAEYVDVEWRAEFSSALIAASGGRRIVLSSHDFEHMPADLVERARMMRAAGAEVIKIAGQTSRLADCAALLGAARELAGTQYVVIAMGEQGLATRVLAARLGCAWTYAGSLAAVGQLTSARLLGEFRFRQLSASAQLFGIVGAPVSHSVSPAMHNAAFAAGQIDAVYLPLAAADVEDFADFARAFDLRGASVTIPYKVAVFDRMGHVDAVARRIGAINTIRCDGGNWSGTNTDAAGFLLPLQERRVALGSARAAIVGAGGAARAVAVALGGCGARVTVHARNRLQAEEVAALGGGQAGHWPIEPRTWDLLVNCTPVGMHPRTDDSVVPARALTGQVVYDLVYNPPLTRLLKEAATAGCQVIGGLDMLVGQAARQFEWWTGVAPHPGVMRAAAERRLAEFAKDEDHVV